jgi:Family of unknown function (DUF6508)
MRKIEIFIMPLEAQQQENHMVPTLPARVMNNAWARLRALSFAVDVEAATDRRLNRTLGPTDSLMFSFHMAIGAAGLVRPFSWTTWEAPMLTTDMVPNLNDEMAWKHMTRIVRADRFNEGVFDMYARSGVVTALARHLYELRQTENGWPTDFPVNPDGSVESGIAVMAGRGLIRGATTGHRYRCPECNGGWSIECELRGGHVMRVCSRDWHFLADHKEVHMLRRDSLATVFRQVENSRQVANNDGGE